MDTEAVAIFVIAAQAGSLSAAARRLGLSPLLATRRLAALEHELGVRLMHRTTRALSLTPEGETFLPHAQMIVDGEQAARASLGGTSGAHGLLRVSAPISFGRKLISPLIPTLLADNPGLRVDLHLSDQVVDIVSAGFDLAIRIARLRDNGLIARKLGPSPRLPCAAPSYLRAHGLPRVIDDLAGHECLTLSGVTHWSFRRQGVEHRVRVSGRYSANAIDGLLEPCRSGAGIALIADWNVRRELAEGSLVPITLADADPDDLAIWAVHPTTRLVPAKLRVFVALLESKLGQPSG